MKSLSVAAGLVGALGVVISCGGDDRAPTINSGASTSAGGTPSVGGKSGGKGDSAGEGGAADEGGSAGKGGRGGTGGTDGGGAGDGGMGGAIVEMGIEVTMVAPLAASDPNDDEVIVADEVTATCLVRATAVDKPVDPSSILLDVLVDGQPVMGVGEKPLQGQGVPTGNADEYSFDFLLGSVPSGSVTFRCSASGLDSSLKGSASVAALVDHGPVITAQLPVKDSPHPLIGALQVKFTVAPALLTADDEEADVATLLLKVAGKEIAANEDTNSLGTYTAVVDFSTFEEQPTEHTSIRIEATNSRSPAAAKAVLDYPFVVDGEGPILSFTDPVENTPVDGEKWVTLKATDTGAGVNLETLIVTVDGGDGPQKYDPALTTLWKKLSNDTFQFRVDTASLEGIESQILLTVNAKDLAGNVSDGDSLTLILDDKPPSIDMDPPNGRGENSNNVCSTSFDVLGDAVNDLQTVHDHALLFRAVVYDRTNFASGEKVSYMAGVNQGTVGLFLQPNPGVGLLVDTNDDDTCDDVVEGLTFKTLDAVAKGGDLFLSPSGGGDSPPTAGECSLPVTGSGPTKTMCDGKSDLYGVIQHNVDSGPAEPVVYVVDQAAGTSCTGATWNIHNLVGNGANKDGWICLATRATDNLGNRSVSRPIRVCYDSVEDPATPDCSNPPSCALDCTPPPSFGAHIYKF